LIAQSVKNSRELDVFGGGMELLHNDLRIHLGTMVVVLPNFKAVGSLSMPDQNAPKIVDWSRIAAAIEAAYIRELMAR
jgi:hypothetical protein